MKNILLIFLDTLIILASYLLALLMCFDFLFSRIPQEYYEAYWSSMPFWVIATIVVFYGMKLYHSIWRLASVSDLVNIIVAHIALVLVYGAECYDESHKIVCTWHMQFHHPYPCTINQNKSDMCYYNINKI